MCESVFKVLLIGDTKVGKTSMVLRYCYNKWVPALKSTVGADFAVKSIKWSNTESVRLHLWDLAGQDHFRAMHRTYFRGASGCVVMFDITNRTSFEHAREWKAELDAKVLLPNGEPIPTILLANKDDLPDKAVTSEEISSFAQDTGFCDWNTISVKDNKKISDSINQLIEKMLQHEHDTGTVQQAEDIDNIMLTDPGASEGPGRCC